MSASDGSVTDPATAAGTAWTGQADRSDRSSSNTKADKIDGTWLSDRLTM
jgi:hypothetical protein